LIIVDKAGVGMSSVYRRYQHLDNKQHIVNK